MGVNPQDMPTSHESDYGAPIEDLQNAVMAPDNMSAQAAASYP